jgi:hypothetical protein
MSQRWIIGLLLITHGLAHLFGFLTSWDLIDVPGISRTPTMFTDELPIGVLRDIGALWLLGLGSFSVAGYGAIQGKRWWKSVAFVSAIVSFIATIFWIHEAWPGTIINAVIVLLIARTWRHDHNSTGLSSTGLTQ